MAKVEPTDALKAVAPPEKKKRVFMTIEIEMVEVSAGSARSGPLKARRCVLKVAGRDDITESTLSRTAAYEDTDSAVRALIDDLEDFGFKVSEEIEGPVTQ